MKIKTSHITDLLKNTIVTLQYEIDRTDTNKVDEKYVKLCKAILARYNRLALTQYYINN